MEKLHIAQGSKTDRYRLLLEQVRSVTEGEPDLIANMANTASMIHETFGFWWTGFYRVQGDELVLGPFQGPLACTRIKRGRGVCGTAWAKGQTLVVPNVDHFPGHIACSSASRSEIVVPLMDAQGKVMAVLDIDSDQLNTFDSEDAQWLEKIAGTIKA
jgi:GAF domain-containing protein